jgi:hypothetical protein
MSLLKPLAVLILLWLEITTPSLCELTYAPTKVECPNDFGIRQGRQSIGSEERAYNEGRRTKVLAYAYHQYLDNLNAFIASSRDKSLALPSYVTRILSSKNETELPRLSIAVGGGAYRGKINCLLPFEFLININLWAFSFRRHLRGRDPEYLGWKKCQFGRYGDRRSTANCRLHYWAEWQRLACGLMGRVWTRASIWSRPWRHG